MTMPISPGRFSRPLLAVALVAAACDGSYQGFLDAVPEPTSNALGAGAGLPGGDGMSRRAFDLARDRGAFVGWIFSAGAISAASWSRAPRWRSR